MANDLAPGEFSAALAGLGKLLAVIQAGAVTAEDIAAKIDPAIAPEIMAAQLLLPLFAGVLEILGTQQGAYAPDPVTTTDPTQFSRGR